MQEWVETLRSKLREMKIISPRENLYTKLPEIRPPLLPTRDPTSPLPATPPVPAAIVPGVEQIVTHHTTNSNVPQTNAETIRSTASTTSNFTSTASVSSMSNTLTQNLLNMLSDPISTYSEQLNDNEIHGIDLLEHDIDDDDECFSDLSDEKLLVPLSRSNLKENLPNSGKTSKYKKLSQTHKALDEAGTSTTRVNTTENNVRVDIELKNKSKGIKVKLCRLIQSIFIFIYR